jgi:hypothetical protein
MIKHLGMMITRKGGWPKKEKKKENKLPKTVIIPIAVSVPLLLTALQVYAPLWLGSCTFMLNTAFTVPVKERFTGLQRPIC